MGVLFDITTKSQIKSSSYILCMRFGSYPHDLECRFKSICFGKERKKKELISDRVLE